MPLLPKGEPKAHFDPPGKSLIACKGLSLHTSQPGKGGACGEEYAAAGYMQNGKLKFHLSSPASKSLRAPNVSSREVGLIETGDGPLGPTLHPVCQKVDHSLLNNQTLYDGRRPPLSRDNVIQAHSQAISSFETTTPTGPFEGIGMDSRGSSSGGSDDWEIIDDTAVIGQFGDMRVDPPRIFVFNHTFASCGKLGWQFWIFELVLGDIPTAIGYILHHVVIEHIASSHNVG